MTRYWYCTINPKRLWTNTSCLKESTATTTTTSVVLLAQAVCPKSALFCVTCCCMDLSEQPVSGAAQRLRSWLRHERMTVAMALAESTQHSSRGQTIARAGVWGHELLNYTATIRNPPTPQPELFSLYDEEPGGSRLDRMPTLSGPQEQVLRHTVDQIVVGVSALPTFDVPVPQTVDQQVGALLHLDTPIPEHAIFEVPKISCPSRFPRSALREPQKAEQLVIANSRVSRGGY